MFRVAELGKTHYRPSGRQNPGDSGRCGTSREEKERKKVSSEGGGETNEKNSRGGVLG